MRFWTDEQLKEEIRKEAGPLLHGWLNPGMTQGQCYRLMVRMMEELKRQHEEARLLWWEGGIEGEWSLNEYFAPEIGDSYE